IHVAVGGYDSGPSDGGYCDSYSGSGCDYSVWSLIGLGVSDAIALARLGTYQFDLSPGDCATTCPNEIPETQTESHCTTSFKMAEGPAPTPRNSPLQLGDPHYNSYVSSATPFTLSSADAGVQGFQYRFHKQGAALAVYASSPFPVYWTNASLSGSQS